MLSTMLLASFLGAPPSRPCASQAPHPRPATQETQDLEARLDACLVAASKTLGGLEVELSIGSDTLLHRALGAGIDGKARRVGARLRAPVALRALVSIALLKRLGVAGAGEVPPLDLDRPIAAFLPAITFEGDQPSLRQVLAGTSGLTPYGDVLTRAQRSGSSADELLAIVAAEGLVAGPGRCFDPNESEILLLCRLLEVHSGAPLEDALGALFAEAGLAATGFVAEADAPPRVQGEATLELDLVSRPTPALWPFGEDRLCTTVPDLARLAQLLAGRELLPEGTLAELIISQRVELGGTTGFGLGLDLVQLGGLQGVTLGGGGIGGALHVVRYPERDLTLVLAATRADAPLAELARDLASLVFDVKPAGVQDLPLPPALAQRLVGAYQVGCDLLTVRLDSEGRLGLNWMDRSDRTLLYQGEARFVAAENADTVVEFRLEADDPRARSLVLSEHGQRIEAVRID